MKAERYAARVVSRAAKRLKVADPAMVERLIQFRSQQPAGSYEWRRANSLLDNAQTMDANDWHSQAGLLMLSDEQLNALLSEDYPPDDVDLHDEMMRLIRTGV